MSPTPSADDLARLRRMVAEPTTTTYSDAALSAVLVRYLLNDRRGTQKDYLQTWEPPVYVDNPDYIATYDFHAAAADIWSEKAAAIVACSFDFKTDAGSFSKSQKHENYMRMVRFHTARRMIRPIKNYPDRGQEDRTGYIINTEDL